MARLRNRVVAALCIALPLYALYWVLGIVQAQIYRTSFLLLALLATFLSTTDNDRSTRRRTLDVVLAVLTVLALAWPIIDIADFPYRAATPNAIDLTLGALTILLVLEATRRTAGWAVPVTAIAFLVYAYYGPLFDLVGLGAIAHRGYYPDRLIGSLYMTLEGIFGVPLDVASTYIILFTLFGAVLEQSGAGKFFIAWALAAMGRTRSAASPARATTLAGLLLGTVSGSAVATTSTLGSICWPLLRRAGYPPNAAGGMLAAAGIGSLMAPPTLGAAGFLIAEFLQIPYVQVLLMATLPVLLYYWSVFLMINGEVRRMELSVLPTGVETLKQLTLREGYHFLSLLAFTALLISGMSAFRAVVWATAIAALLSFVRRENRLGWRGALRALEAGGRSILPIVATTATAGIIVGVVTLTGLGLKIAGLIVSWAGGSVFLTVLFAAFAVWLLGLAVPVTASYIIAAVMIAPALIDVGIAPVAAHMFIFYYAVLSEVSPPTALAPYAAAAITGGDALQTTLRSWKYTIPAFIVPFAFTIEPAGLGLLLQSSVGLALQGGLSAALGVSALAIGVDGWLTRQLSLAERSAACVSGLLLLYPSTLADLTGAALFAIVVVSARYTRSTLRTSEGPSEI